MERRITSGAVLPACAGKEGYDGIDHDSIHEGETVVKRPLYKVELAGPDVTEKAATFPLASKGIFLSTKNQLT